MRHRVYGKHLNRDKNQRTALFRGLIRSLVLSQSITTTDAKAKAIKGLVDRLISKARENTEASRRVIYSNLPQKEISKKLLEEVAPSYKERNSGFTEVVRLGRRSGDGAMMVKMSLIKDGQEKPSIVSLPDKEEKTEKPKTDNKTRQEEGKTK